MTIPQAKNLIESFKKSATVPDKKLELLMRVLLRVKDAHGVAAANTLRTEHELSFYGVEELT